MNNKIYKLLVALLFITIIFSSYSTTLANSNNPQSTNPPANVTLTVSDKPLIDDSNWTVVSTISGDSTDKVSGKTVHWKLTHKLNPNPTPADGSSCADNLLTSPLTALTTCTYNRDESVSWQGSMSTIVGHITQYSHQYCSEPSCLSNVINHLAYQVSVSWTRSGPSYYLSNSNTSWGCGNCKRCADGSNYIGIWNSGSFSPGWSNNTTSYVYNYTRSDLPIMHGGGDVSTGLTANNGSDVYYNGARIGSLFGQAFFSPQ